MVAPSHRPNYTNTLISMAAFGVAHTVDHWPSATLTQLHHMKPLRIIMIHTLSWDKWYHELLGIFFRVLWYSRKILSTGWGRIFFLMLTPLRNYQPLDERGYNCTIKLIVSPSLSFSLSSSYLLLLLGSERAMEYLMAVDLNMSDGSKWTCERRLSSCGGINNNYYSTCY